MPLIVVIPGLILFAHYPAIMKLPWAQIKPQADQGYVHMLQTLIPIGLRGVFLAALFGAIQSTVQAVLNSTSTIFTIDIYHRLLYRKVSERHLVRVGRISSVIILALAICLARLIPLLGTSLFEYIQTLYAFFAPPFGAVFLLGMLFRRINGQGAAAAVFLGFALSIVIKLYVGLVHNHLQWLEPFMMQAMVNWFFSVVVCVVVSLLTPAPQPEQVGDDLTFNWRRVNILEGLGRTWYTSVVLWWALFVLVVLGLVLVFSGVWL